MYSPRSGIRIGPQLTPMVKALVLICAGIFVWSILIPAIGGIQAIQTFEETFGLVPPLVWGQLFVWQLATYIFLHGDFWHILINMLVLWMFGCQLERVWGSRRFLKFFLITGIGAGVLTVLLDPFSMAVTIGASGSIFGILMAYWMLFPEQSVYLYLVLPIKVKYFVPVIGLINLFNAYQVYVSNNPGVSNVAYLAHLGGMLTAFLYLKGWLSPNNIRKSYYRWKVRRMRSRFEVHEGRRTKARRDDDFWIN